ncbi:MAG: O-acetyl-ADP-ribose deacetylase [Bacillota bacterium]
MEISKTAFNGRIEVVQGDITNIEVDAVVNAANNSLLGGGGVDGAIHRKGGEAILKECLQIRNRQGGCETGKAVITTAGKLPAKYVIHTVGPVWNGGQGGEEEKLRNCYINSLIMARENGIKTIAFPNISTGVYKFPKELAAKIALDEVTIFIQKNEEIQKVLFICFDRENLDIYTRMLI